MGVLEQEIADLLHRKGLTLGAVESATGGLISHLMTNVPGCSLCFRGAVVAYSNEIKTRVIGVSADDMRRFGSVSPQVAQQMAEGGRKLLGVDICLADTGIAGPGGGTAEKPVGLFYFGLAAASGTSTRQHVFHGDREQNKRSAAEAALGWLREFLISLK